MLLYVVCFLRLGVVCCVVVGAWGGRFFVLSVICVVGGVSLWVVCISSCGGYVLSVVLPVAILSVVFCGICSLFMFVSDTSGDRMVETYSREWVLLWLCMLR